MQSFCLKTNNKDILQNLLKQIEKIDFKDLTYSKNKFKIYKNIIIHYLGKDYESFLKFLCEIISNVIIEFYEENLIKKTINFNYFYFEEYEKLKIYNNCIEIMNEKEYEQNNKKEDIINRNIEKYLKENKIMILEGFVNFRLKEYLKYIDNIVDIGVNKYIIDKEYNEFINLLKIYIETKAPKYNLVHLIYMNGESVILDCNKNLISISNNTLNTKYLSDISFSSNDITLNTLLTILPKKIELHIIDEEDDFSNTIKLIFNKRAFVCKDCNICKTYKLLNKKYFGKL